MTVDTLMTAVKTYNIDRGLFFIDACRDAPIAARLLNLVGTQLLYPNPQPMRRPDALIGLRSTASGLQSYQAKDEAGTLFTQAVLDGLQGSPPDFIPYDRTSLPWALKFAALEGHVKRMVTKLLKDHNPLKIQAVEPYGNPYNGDTIVANKEPPLGAHHVPPLNAIVIPTLKEIIAISAANALRATKSLDSLRIFFSRRPDGNHCGDLIDPTLMHEVLGHEDATIPWINSLRYLDARTGKEAPSWTSFMFASHSQQIGDRIVAWLDLSIQPGKGELLWIGTDGTGGVPGSAVVIPRDLLHSMPVRLDVQLDHSGAGWQVTRMSARLADPTPFNERNSWEHMPDSWTTLFEAQKTEAFADLASAARPIEEQFDRLQQILSAKRESPIAAAFATNLLLRAGGTAYLQDWPRNLANWFEWLADGPVLWAETLLRQRDSESLDLVDPKVREALQYFLKLADRGVPTLADTLLFAIRQAALWRESDALDVLTPEEQSNLRTALEYIDRAGQYVVSGMGFAHFMGASADFTPEHVLGAHAASTSPN